MIDLKKLQALFDEFFKTETIESFNEWLKSKSEVEEVPPGIIKFSNNSMTYTRGDVDYNKWVKIHLSEGDTIRSISVEGVTYSVGEKLTVGIIKSLEWIKNAWFADVEDNRGSIYPYVLKSFLKLPQPPERKIDGDFTKADIKLTGTETFKPEERKIVGWKLVESDPKYYKKETVYLGNWQPIYSEPNPPVCELPDEKYRIGKRQNRVILTMDGTKTIAMFSKGYEELAIKCVDFLNNYKAKQ